MLQRLVGGSSGVAPAFKSGFVAEQGKELVLLLFCRFNFNLFL